MTEATVVVVPLTLALAQAERCATLLDSAEIIRAGRFLRDEDRARYMTSHAALRLILGATLGLSPDTLDIGQDDSGRPYLTNPVERRYDFNLSHSGRYALIGLARSARIGVDVEARRPLPDALRIAKSHFAPDEAAALADLPRDAREEAFFGLWTRKEAVVKALGAGLSLPLNDFTVTVPPAAPRVLHQHPTIAGTADGWTLMDLAVGGDASATVAVTGRNTEINVRHMPHDWLDAFRAK